MPKSRENRPTGLTSLLLALSCILLSQLPARLVQPAVASGRPSLDFLLVSAALALLQLPLLWYARARLGVESNQAAGLATHNPGLSSSQLIAVFAVFAAASAVFAGLSSLWPTLAPEAAVGLAPATGHPMILIAAACLFALAIGWQEELLYRYVLVGSLTRLGTAAGEQPLPAQEDLAVLIGALLFGYGHLYQGLAGFGAAVLLSLALSALVRRGWPVRSLALGHAAWDLLVILWLLFGLPISGK